MSGFKWDYTFYRWGYKYLYLVKGHNCMKSHVRCQQTGAFWLPCAFLKFDYVWVSSCICWYWHGCFLKWTEHDLHWLDETWTGWKLPYWQAYICTKHQLKRIWLVFFRRLSCWQTMSWKSTGQKFSHPKYSIIQYSVPYMNTPQSGGSRLVLNARDR